MGTTVFPQGFAETARTHFHTLHERKTSTISFDDVDGDIGDIKSVEDAFVLFGLKPDDRTSRREQIKMWKHIERAITTEIKRLTGSGRSRPTTRPTAERQSIKKRGFMASDEGDRATRRNNVDVEQAKKGLAQHCLNEKERKREERREMKALSAPAKRCHRA